MKNLKCIHSDQPRLFEMGRVYEAIPTPDKKVVYLKVNYSADLLDYGVWQTDFGIMGKIRFVEVQ